MYQITATVTRTVDGWTSTRQVPTFYLSPDVQGITSADHAARIARRMLADLAGDGATVDLVALAPGDYFTPHPMDARIA